MQMNERNYFDQGYELGYAIGILKASLKVAMDVGVDQEEIFKEEQQLQKLVLYHQNWQQALGLGMQDIDSLPKVGGSFEYVNEDVLIGKISDILTKGDEDG